MGPREKGNLFQFQFPYEDSGDYWKDEQVFSWVPTMFEPTSAGELV